MVNQGLEEKVEKMVFAVVVAFRVKQAVEKTRVEAHLVVGWEQRGKYIESLVSYPCTFIGARLCLAELLHQLFNCVSWKG
jgi:hypothetical protein